MTTREAIFSTIILETLPEKQSEITSELRKQLSEKSWLHVSGHCISPQRILRITPKELRCHLEEIVELSAGEFIGDSALSSEVRTKLSRLGLLTAFEATDIIVFVLSKPNPHLHAHIICDTLHLLYKNQKLDEHIVRRVQEVSWLPDKLNNAIIPSAVIHYPKIKEEVEEILASSTEGSYIASSQLSSAIKDHDCFQWLQELDNFLIKGQQALKLIGQLLKPIPKYWLGNFPQEKFPLSAFFKSFQNASPEILPIWSLARKLGKENFEAYILSHILQGLDTSRLSAILKYISSTYSSPDSVVLDIYNQYLELACQDEKFASDILPNIQLCNLHNEWRNPQTLCWEDEVYPIVTSKAVLSKTQRSILTTYLSSLSRPQSFKRVEKHSQLEESCSQVDILYNYFQPWQLKVQDQFIGAFLCLITGGNEELEELAKRYLQNRVIEQVRNRLLESKNICPKKVQVSLIQGNDSTVEVLSVAGNLFCADKSADLTNIIGFSFVIIKPSVEPVQLQLIPFDITTYEGSLEKLLKKEIQKLIRKLYEVSLQNFEATWNNLIRSKQLDIQVARNFVLKGAPYVLRELGVHKNSNILNQLLQNWKSKEREQSELEVGGEPTQSIDQELREIIRCISNLFEEKSPEGEHFRQFSLQAVRKKMSDYGYYPTSIPFELFQNADDVVIEMERIEPDKPLDDARKRVILDLNNEKLTFMHWGRPINHCWASNNTGINYREKGFDQDLEKMVVLNISDKAAGSTGKFGLGFKSIHLACNRSQIVSGDLAFTVLGGLLPSKIVQSTVTDDLRRELKAVSHLKDGTLIKLFIDRSLPESLDDIIADFQAKIPLLLVFAKRIRQCVVSKNGQSVEFKWGPITLPGMTSVEIGEVSLQGSVESIQDNTVCRHKVIRLRTEGTDDASLLLTFVVKNQELVASLPEGMPTFWVTAPTRETLPLGFILNANFDITTGRESLTKASQYNLELADRIGTQIGKTLVELFQQTQQDWQGFSTTVKINSVDPYTFWYFIWQELAVKWVRRSDSSAMLQIIRRILGGSNGISYLMSHQPCLPSGLWGEYRQLMSPQQAKYIVKGILSTKKTCFIKVAQWWQFRQNCHQNVVSQGIWSDWQTLRGNQLSHPTLKPVTLLTSIQWEIGCSTPKAEIQQSHQLGELLTNEFINSLEINEESKELRQFLQQIHFLSEDNTYQNCAQLMVAGAQSSQEEKRLARLAPLSTLLKSTYTDAALDFFYTCREQVSPEIKVPIIISTQTLVTWVLNAQVHQRQAVRDYLYEGDRKDELARQLIQQPLDSWFFSDHEIHFHLNYARGLENLRSGGAYSSGSFISPIATDETLTTPQPDGIGNTKWGNPGECLAAYFYKEVLGYTLAYSDTRVIDFKCSKGNEVIEVEVKAISSEAIRLPMYEWDRLTNIQDRYEMLIVHHDGGTVIKVFRVKQVWNTLMLALKNLKTLKPTQARKDSDNNHEALLGFQQEDDSGNNIVILNWKRFIQEYESVDSYKNIESYFLQAQLIEGEREVLVSRDGCNHRIVMADLFQ